MRITDATKVKEGDKGIFYGEQLLCMDTGRGWKFKNILDVYVEIETTGRLQDMIDHGFEILREDSPVVFECNISNYLNMDGAVTIAGSDLEPFKGKRVKVTVEEIREPDHEPRNPPRLIPQDYKPHTLQDLWKKAEELNAAYENYDGRMAKPRGSTLAQLLDCFQVCKGRGLFDPPGKADREQESVVLTVLDGGKVYVPERFAFSGKVRVTPIEQKESGGR